MEESKSQQKPRGRFLKYLLRTLVAVVVLALAGHFAWKYSGDGQWRQAIDKDGIRVYTLKAPGSTLEKVKAVSRIKTSLNRAVASMMDASLENCADWEKACVVSEVVKPWDGHTHAYTQFYRMDLPKPFEPREFLLHFQFLPDDKANAVALKVDGMPNELPKHDCCVRVEYAHNSWRFTRISEEETDTEMIEDIDIGLPYFMFDMEAAEGAYEVFKDLPRLFNKKQYQGAKPDFIPGNATQQSRRWDGGQELGLFATR